jgi:hypothetical protein
MGHSRCEISNADSELELENRVRLFGGMHRTAPLDSRWKDGAASRETLAANRQLAWDLDGKYKKVKPLQSWISDGTSGIRRYDVEYRDGFSELKFGGNHVYPHQVKEDGLLRRQGIGVRYDIVPHPITGKSTSNLDLDLLKKFEIPYKVWRQEFWHLPRGGGLDLEYTWKPSAQSRS